MFPKGRLYKFLFAIKIMVKPKAKYERGEFVICDNDIIEITSRWYGYKSAYGFFLGEKREWFYDGRALRIVETGNENIPLVPKFLTGRYKYPESSLSSIDDLVKT